VDLPGAAAYLVPSQALHRYDLHLRQCWALDSSYDYFSSFCSSTVLGTFRFLCRSSHPCRFPRRLQPDHQFILDWQYDRHVVQYVQCFRRGNEFVKYDCVGFFRGHGDDQQYRDQQYRDQQRDK
jgi:hypothetical protein